MLITDLEIGAVGIDFSRRRSWWARENPERARTWKSMKSMKNDTFYNVVLKEYPNRKNNQ
jgi:hypothetical protein